MKCECKWPCEGFARIIYGYNFESADNVNIISYELLQKLYGKKLVAKTTEPSIIYPGEVTQNENDKEICSFPKVDAIVTLKDKVTYVFKGIIIDLFSSAYNHLNVFTFLFYLYFSVIIIIVMFYLSSFVSQLKLQINFRSLRIRDHLLLKAPLIHSTRMGD